MSIPVTLLYGGLNGLLLTLLGVNVSLGRLKNHTGVGDDGPADFVRVIRAHGNGAEWLPLQIVLLLMLELGGGGSTMLHVAGGTVLGARLLQVASHLLRAPTGTIGATLTYLVTAGMAGWAVWMRFA